MSKSRDEEKALDYMVYGILCAAKRETGPSGARRLSRIQERTNWEEEGDIEASLRRLIALGWVMQLPRDEFGFVYFEVDSQKVEALPENGGEA